MLTRTRLLASTLLMILLLAVVLLLHGRGDGGAGRVFSVWHPLTSGATGLGRGDGDLGGGEVSVHEGSEPAVARLDPRLRAALVEATDDAAAVGVTLRINSGWRSAAYQRVLLEEAEKTYGNATEAGRWVRTPQTSTHVSGKAVDIGPTSATRWLAQHGARYGLCQTYANEPWHFELRATQGRRCPSPRPDSSS
jgi:D-alanyl-D-alanine carboxypeptidase